MDTEQILLTLEHELKSFEQPRIIPLACDKWLCASSLQKSIRRGFVNLALRAGFTLWQQDRVSFWRRLHIIAVEDVGVSAPDIVVKVLTAFSNSTWRNRHNDLNVGLYLIVLLCGADKTRVADELLAIAANGIHLKHKRRELFFAENDCLAKVVLDKEGLLPERALALWLLAGTDILPHDALPKRRGNPQLAAELLHGLCQHKPLARASVAVMRKTQWPLGLLTPLIYETLVGLPKGEQTKIVRNVFSSDADIRGIPLVALDSYTRVGKSAIRELQSKTPELKFFSTKQIGVGLFYTEGEMIGKRFSSVGLDAIRQDAFFADFEGAGGDIPSLIGLCSVLNQKAPLIASIRKNKMRDYFQNWDGEFAFEGRE